MIGSDFNIEQFSRAKRCSECLKKISVNTKCLVSRDRNGKNKKIVCSENCRLEFDDRYWQHRVDRRKFKEGNRRRKNDQA